MHTATLEKVQNGYEPAKEMIPIIVGSIAVDEQDELLEGLKLEAMGYDFKHDGRVPGRPSVTAEGQDFFGVSMHRHPPCAMLTQPTTPTPAAKDPKSLPASLRRLRQRRMQALRAKGHGDWQPLPRRYEGKFQAGECLSWTFHPALH
jgi:hypothetical protein